MPCLKIVKAPYDGILRYRMPDWAISSGQNIL
jgi:hypothetical protein